MHIPVEQIEFSEYQSRLKTLLQQPSTHIYLDTSFLMWLTNVGTKARSEFRAWISDLSKSRVHVPTWASHEFYRHFVDKTTASLASKRASELQKTLTRTYPALVPAFCEPIGGTQDSETARITARSAFSKLFELSASVEKWSKENAGKNCEEVIELINLYGIRNKSLFKYFSDIGTLTENRFSGRIPPGFKDEGKKDGEKSDGAVIGGNRAGDLLFWKEILDHVNRHNFARFGVNSIRDIVILTNDGKNDWVRGGGKPRPPDDAEVSPLRTAWDPIPMIHPMLEHEASSVAGLKSVMLANSEYLGTYFYKQDRKSAFARAATCTAFSSTAPLSPAKLTKKSVGAIEVASPVTQPTFHSAFENKTDSAKASQLLGALFSDLTLPEANEAASFVDDMLRHENRAVSLQELLVPLNATEKPFKFHAWLGRNLATAAIRDSGMAADRLQDLAGMLPSIGAEQSTCIYCGLLIGTYFDASGKPRIPPPFAHLDLLTSFQQEPFAIPGVIALTTALQDNRIGLLYTPNKDGLKVGVKVLSTLVASERTLTGLFIGVGRDMLDPTCTEPDLMFSAVFPGKTQLRSSELILAACKIYGVPESAIAWEKDQSITLPSNAGFCVPTSVIEVNE